MVKVAHIRLERTELNDSLESMMTMALGLSFEHSAEVSFTYSTRIGTAKRFTIQPTALYEAIAEEDITEDSEDD